MQAVLRRSDTRSLGLKLSAYKSDRKVGHKRVHKRNNKGPRLEPWGTPGTKMRIINLRPPQLTKKPLSTPKLDQILWFHALWIL